MITHVKTHSIRLQASNLAAYIGMNPYKKQSELVEALWYKRNPSTFKACFAGSEIKDCQTEISKNMKRFPQASQFSEQAAAAAKTACTVDEITSERDKLVASVEATIKEARIKADKLGELAITDNNVIKELEVAKRDCLVLQTAGADVKHEIQRAANTTFGTTKEQQAIQAYERDTGVKVIRLPGFRSISLRSNVTLTGGVDGMIGDDCILEVKNRTRRLFGRIPEYERVQVEAYMRIFDKHKAVLLEVLLQKEPGPNGSANFKYNVLSATRDDHFWEEILCKVQRVVCILDDLCDDATKGNEYVTMSPRSREDNIRCRTLGYTVGKDCGLSAFDA